MSYHQFFSSFLLRTSSSSAAADAESVVCEPLSRSAAIYTQFNLRISLRIVKYNSQNTALYDKI